MGGWLAAGHFHLHPYYGETLSSASAFEARTMRCVASWVVEAVTGLLLHLLRVVSKLLGRLCIV